MLRKTIVGLAALAALAGAAAAEDAAKAGPGFFGNYCGEIVGTLQGRELKSYECWEVSPGAAPNVRVLKYQDPLDKRDLFARKVTKADGSYFLYDHLRADQDPTPGGEGRCRPENGGYRCRGTFGRVLIYDSGTFDDFITADFLEIDITATYSWGWRVAYKGRLLKQQPKEN